MSISNNITLIIKGNVNILLKDGIIRSSDDIPFIVYFDEANGILSITNCYYQLGILEYILLYNINKIDIDNSASLFIENGHCINGINDIDAHGGGNDVNYIADINTHNYSPLLITASSDSFLCMPNVSVMVIEAKKHARIDIIENLKIPLISMNVTTYDKSKVIYPNASVNIINSHQRSNVFVAKIMSEVASNSFDVNAFNVSVVTISGPIASLNANAYDHSKIIGYYQAVKHMRTSKYQSGEISHFISKFSN